MRISDHKAYSISSRLTRFAVLFLAVGTVASYMADEATGMPQSLGASVSASNQNEMAIPVKASSDSRAPNIDRVYGSRSLFVDQEENYRVRLKHGAYWPIHYNWELGDGTITTGNNVVQRFSAPGNYRLDVRVSNAYGEDSTSIWVSVLEIPIPVDIAEESAGHPAVLVKQHASEIGDGVSITSQTSESDYYFSWILETHLNRSRAEHAARNYAKIFPDHVRVFTEADGGGSTAYRVVVGRYATTGNALRTKTDIEEKAGRSVMLITIRS